MCVFAWALALAQVFFGISLLSLQNNALNQVKYYFPKSKENFRMFCKGNSCVVVVSFLFSLNFQSCVLPLVIFQWLHWAFSGLISILMWSPRRRGTEFEKCHDYVVRFGGDNTALHPKMAPVWNGINMNLSRNSWLWSDSTDTFECNLFSASYFGSEKTSTKQTVHSKYMTNFNNVLLFIYTFFVIYRSAKKLKYISMDEISAYRMTIQREKWTRLHYTKSHFSLVCVLNLLWHFV